MITKDLYYKENRFTNQKNNKLFCSFFLKCIYYMQGYDKNNIPLLG